MAVIAVVEDEQAISRLICLHLKSAGYEPHAYETGEAFLRALPGERPDVLLLDWMLPGGADGMEVLSAVRRNERTRALPVIMLTAKAEEVDRVLGLEAGADDYLTKPFSFREMVSRVRAQLRRRQWDQGEPAALAHGCLAIYPREHCAKVDGRPLALSPKEYDILCKLMERPNWVHSRENLLGALWSADFEGGARAVDMHMTNLRRKLDEAGAKDYIQTVRGVGYRMRALSAGEGSGPGF